MDDEGTLIVDGFGGVGDDFSRNALYKEHFHYLPDVKHGGEVIEIDASISPGESITKKLRGVGQLGILLKIASEQTDLKVTFYSDNNKTLKIAEVEL